MEDIITLIANVGFPGACCIAMFWYMSKQADNHKAEIDKLTESIQGNTKVLTELRTLIKTLAK